MSLFHRKNRLHIDINIGCKKDLSLKRDLHVILLCFKELVPQSIRNSLKFLNTNDTDRTQQENFNNVYLL